MGKFSDAVGILAPIAIGATTMHMANKKAKEVEKRQFVNEQILADLEASRQEIINPYENLAVATQAAEFEAEQADLALANTLDTLRATGAGAGGATALAQAALQSKQGVSASIEKQEVQNQALKAQGEQAAFEARELREMQRLDRQAGLVERDMAQVMQYRADGMSALMGGVNASSQVAAAVAARKQG